VVKNGGSGKFNTLTEAKFIQQQNELSLMSQARDVSAEECLLL
jgi:hypothetical protein